MKDHESAFPVMDATRVGMDYGCTDTGMTKYEYAAIHLKVPRSGNEDIDAMIRESRRTENMQAENELKPRRCPFCGEHNSNDLGVIVENRCIPGPAGHVYYKNYNVACSCGALGPDGETRKEAVERWNRRKA